MLGATIKGRDEHGYPLEGVDMVPNGPREEETIPRLIQLLQDANRRADRANQASEDIHRKYLEVEKENSALKCRDYCESCQKKADTTPEGLTVETCRKCSENHQTIQSLRLELDKRDREIRYWQDCYETALGESEKPCVKCDENYHIIQSLKLDLAKKDEDIKYWTGSYTSLLGENFQEIV